MGSCVCVRACPIICLFCGIRLRRACVVVIFVCPADIPQQQANTRSKDLPCHSASILTHRHTCRVISILAKAHWHGVPHELFAAEAQTCAAYVGAGDLGQIGYSVGARRRLLKKCCRNNRQTQADTTKTDRLIQSDSDRHGQTHTDTDRQEHIPIANTRTHTRADTGTICIRYDTEGI